MFDQLLVYIKCIIYASSYLQRVREWDNSLSRGSLLDKYFMNVISFSFDLCNQRIFV